MKVKKASVFLISLPWTSLTEPSLGLGILSACLKQEKIPCRVMHLNLFVLEHMQAYSYFGLANIFALNDFLFSGVLEPEVSHKQEQWLRIKARELLHYDINHHKQYGGVEDLVEKLLHLRKEIIPFWLDQWADKISASDATLVGMTCMFDQTIASLALAHLIRKNSKDKLIVLGGYAVRTPTGEAILRSFPFIDAICIGEGEPSIIELAKVSEGIKSLSDVPNIIYRNSNKNIVASVKASLVDMDNIPIPDFDDFFRDIKALSTEHQIQIKVDRLPVENSRGCWWGQTRHCVFCGIKDEDLHYRYRNAERVINTMVTLQMRYGLNKFRFSDYILPYKYFKTLIPRLIQLKSPFLIISEVKANMKKDQFQLLAQAGFEEVQPGIESFSSKLLSMMDKGVDAIQNVYVLLLGKQFGIPVLYNMLYGLPSDDPAEISKIIELIPQIRHLDAPSTKLPIQITRFSPLQINPKRFGIDSSEYEPSYNLIFSYKFLQERGFDLNDFCYYFERPYENTPKLNRLYAQMDQLIDDWKREQIKRKIEFSYKKCDNEIEITDSRKDETPEIYKLNAIESFVYEKITDPVTMEILKQRCIGMVNQNDMNRMIGRFKELGLVFQEKDKILGLALLKK